VALLKGRKGYESFVMEGLSREIANPLERGKGHGIVGAKELINLLGVKSLFLTLTFGFGRNSVNGPPTQNPI